MKKLLFLTILLLIFACQDKARQSSNFKNGSNPFFEKWDTPFEIPPFSHIKDEHYMPAFEKGMEENLEEIENIINNSEEPSFSNTIEELERTGKLLSRVQRTFFNLAGKKN